MEYSPWSRYQLFPPKLAEKLEEAFRVLGDTPRKPVPETISEPALPEMDDREPPGQTAEPVQPALADIDAEERGIPYMQWKANQLNAIFARLGSGGPGRLTTATIQHGLDKEAQATKGKIKCVIPPKRFALTSLALDGSAKRTSFNASAATGQSNSRRARGRTGAAIAEPC